MGHDATSQHLYLLDQAFAGDGWHSLLANLHATTPEDWTWLPTGGSRSMPGLPDVRAGIPDRVVCAAPAGAPLAQLESKDTQWAHQLTAIELGKNKKRRAIGRPPTSPSSSLTGASPTCSGFGSAASRRRCSGIGKRLSSGINSKPATVRARLSGRRFERRCQTRPPSSVQAASLAGSLLP